MFEYRIIYETQTPEFEKLFLLCIKFVRHWVGIQTDQFGSCCNRSYQGRHQENDFHVASGISWELANPIRPWKSMFTEFLVILWYREMPSATANQHWLTPHDFALYVLGTQSRWSIYSGVSSRGNCSGQYRRSYATVDKWHSGVSGKTIMVAIFFS